MLPRPGPTAWILAAFVVVALVAGHAAGVGPGQVCVVGALALLAGLIGGRARTYAMMLRTRSATIERHKSWDGFLVGYLAAVLVAGLAVPSGLLATGAVFAVSLNALYALCKLRCRAHGCCGARREGRIDLRSAEAAVSGAVAALSLAMLWAGIPAGAVLLAALAGHAAIRVYSKARRRAPAVESLQAAH